MSMTIEDVLSILGPADETFIAEIISTGATADELAQAWAWTNADDVLMDEGRGLPSGKVAELIDLLTPDQDEP